MNRNEHIAQIGDNEPPSNSDALRARLAEENQALTERLDELIAAAERAPETIKDEDTAQRVTDFIKQPAACHKNAEAKRVDAKEPFLNAGRTVDGFFKAITKPLNDAKLKIERRLTDYQRAKELAERRAREEDARKAAEEAAKAAEAIADDNSLDDAIIAEQAAQDALKAAEAKAADLSRTRGDYGGVSSLRDNWTFEIVDFSKVPDQLKIIDEKKVRGLIKGKNGVRDIPGLRIYNDQRTVVR